MKKEAFKIIIKEQAGLMRGRIKDMLKPLDLDILECTSDKVLFHNIREYSELLCCIILHIDEIEDYDIVNKIRSREKDLQIIVLTANKKRNFHIRGIQIGVSDLILVPFKDSTLYSKVQRYVDEKRNSYIELVSFDFDNYLQGEIRKAEKGSFPLTLMFTTLVVNEEAELESDELEHNYYSNIYFNEIRKLFWKTDISIRFHTRYFLGVFPFCRKENSEIIEKKILDRFQHLLKERMIPTSFKSLILFSTFPDDSDDLFALQNILYQKAQSADKGLKIKWFKERGSKL